MTNAALVAGIRSGDREAEAELYDKIRHMRFAGGGHVTGEEEDEAQETFLAVWTAIRAGTLDHDGAIWGYVDTVRRRRHWQHIFSQDWYFPLNEALPWQAREQTDALALEGERMKILSDGLESLRPRDREILVRFYLWGEPQNAIRDAMHLTETCFRLLKSRAKERLCKAVRQITLVRYAKSKTIDAA